MEHWEQRVQELFNATLPPGAEAVGSYYVGANVPGKATGPLFYFGGAPRYFRETDAVAEGWVGGLHDRRACALMRVQAPIQTRETGT